jgi:ketosteroid isomerase-like protein
MNRSWLSGALAALVAVSAASVARGQAYSQLGASKTIAASFSALNSGDIRAYEALWDADAVLIDDTPPYVWRGVRAVKAWEGVQNAWARKRGVTAMTCALDKTVRTEVAGRRAYVVGEGGCDVTSRGQPLHQLGRWTFTLIHHGGRWRLTAVVFAGGVLMPSGAR